MMNFKTLSSMLPQLFDTLAFFQQIVLLFFAVTKADVPSWRWCSTPAFVLAPTKMVTSPSGYNAPPTHVPNLFSASPGTHQESSGRSALHRCLAGFDTFDLGAVDSARPSKEKLMHNKAVRNLFLVETCGDGGYALMLKSGKAAPARKEQNQGRVAWRDPAEPTDLNFCGSHSVY